MSNRQKISSNVKWKNFIVPLVLSFVAVIVMFFPTMQLDWMAETPDNVFSQHVSWVSPYLFSYGNVLPFFAFLAAVVSLFSGLLWKVSPKFILIAGLSGGLSAVLGLAGRDLSTNSFYVFSLISPVFILVSAVFFMNIYRKARK